MFLVHIGHQKAENLVLDTNLHQKLSIPSSLLGFAKRLKIGRTKDETHNNEKQFLNSTNVTLNADEVNEIGFAGPNDSESYNGANRFDKMHLPYPMLQHYPAMHMTMFAVTLSPWPITRLKVTVVICCTSQKETVTLLRSFQESFNQSAQF